MLLTKFFLVSHLLVQYPLLVTNVSSISDVGLVNRCGILQPELLEQGDLLLQPELWEQGDTLMADRGFSIADLLQPLQVSTCVLRMCLKYPCIPW